MSLEAQVQAAVTAAFDAVDDLALTVQVRRTTPGAYNQTTHTFSETTADTPLEAVITADVLEPDEAGRVPLRKRTLLLKPGAISPRTDDHIVIGSDVCKVASVKAIKPAASVLAWQVEVAG